MAETAPVQVRRHLTPGPSELARPLAASEALAATGGSPESTRSCIYPVRQADAPPLGVWGVRLWVTATKDGDTIQVPYYAGVHVAT